MSPVGAARNSRTLLPYHCEIWNLEWMGGRSALLQVCKHHYYTSSTQIQLSLTLLLVNQLCLLVLPGRPTRGSFAYLPEVPSGGMARQALPGS